MLRNEFTRGFEDICMLASLYHDFLSSEMRKLTPSRVDQVTEGSTGLDM